MILRGKKLGFIVERTPTKSRLAWLIGLVPIGAAFVMIWPRFVVRFVKMEDVP